MKTVRGTIRANGDVRIGQGGFTLICQSLTVDDEVEVRWLRADGTEDGPVEHVAPGRKFRPGYYFSGFRVIGTAGADAEFLVGGQGADADLFDAEVIIGNTGADPIPTEPVLAQALTNVAPVAVGDAATPLVALSAARRVNYVRNVGDNTVALGAAGLAFGDAVIYVQPGETWVEDQAPGAAWFAICDAGLETTINVLTGA
jgi:hypothetical protein